jgi:iron complex transport system substrate-binding protein
MQAPSGLQKGKRSQAARAGSLLLVLLALAATLLAPLGGCAADPARSTDTGSDAAQATQHVTDMAGRSVEVPVVVDKIVGFGSVPLRTISYLGAVDMLSGVELAEQTDYVTCGYRHVNFEQFKALPVVGEGGSNGVTPNEEALALAHPDVVFASIDKDAADALQQKTGIPVICIAQSDKIFDARYYEAIRLIGTVIKKDARAEELVGYLEATQADLAKRTSGAAADRPTAYAAGISFRGGHGFAGTEALFPPFVETGITNVADVGGASGAYDIDIEQVLTAQPDFVFVETSNLSLVKEDYLANPSYFSHLEAVRNKSTYTLVSYRFYGANIELAVANCYWVGSVAYPEQFSDVDPTQKLDEITTFFLGKPLASDLAAQGYSFRQVDFEDL